MGGKATLVLHTIRKKVDRGVNGAIIRSRSVRAGGKATLALHTIRKRVDRGVDGAVVSFGGLKIPQSAPSRT